jgi:hypothetical protein
MMVLRGMRSAKVLMSCRSLWPTLEPQISMLGFILTLGTPPADRSTADCPLLLTVAALSHSLASPPRARRRLHGRASAFT